MSSWAAEQSRDLSRINKHLQLLLQQLDPLKVELKELKKQRDKLQEQVEDFPWLLQAERESQARQKKEAEQCLELKSREHGEAVARLEQDKDKLRRGTTLLPAPPGRSAGSTGKARSHHHEQGFCHWFGWALGAFPCCGTRPRRRELLVGVLSPPKPHQCTKNARTRLFTSLLPCCFEEPFNEARFSFCCRSRFAGRAALRLKGGAGCEGGCGAGAG